MLTYRKGGIGYVAERERETVHLFAIDLFRVTLRCEENDCYAAARSARIRHIRYVICHMSWRRLESLQT